MSRAGVPEAIGSDVVAVVEMRAYGYALDGGASSAGEVLILRVGGEEWLEEGKGLEARGDSERFRGGKVRVGPDRRRVSAMLRWRK